VAVWEEEHRDVRNKAKVRTSERTPNDKRQGCPVRARVGEEDGLPSVFAVIIISVQGSSEEASGRGLAHPALSSKVERERPVSPHCERTP
jgi:hypothetical protein